MKQKVLIRFDWAMKRLLRHKANFDILEGFLSELLKEDIKIKQILDSESNKQTEDDKQNRVDILVENHKGELIIIEVQNTQEYDYFHRMLFGTSKAITEHMKQGDPYAVVKKIISITIAYFDLGQGKDYVYHGTTVFKGIHKGDIMALGEKQIEAYQKFQVYEIYPEYWVIKVGKFRNKINDKLDEWIYFLKNAEIKNTFSAKGLKEANEKLDAMKLSEKDRKSYDGYLKHLHDVASRNHTIEIDAKELIKKAKEEAEEALRKVEEDLTQAKEAEKQAKEALKQAKEQAREAEKQAKDAEKQARDAEKQTKEAEKQAREAEKQAKEDVKQAKEESEIEAVIGLFENDIPNSIIAKSLKIPEERVKQIIENYRRKK